MSTETYLLYQKKAEKKEFKDANRLQKVQKSLKLVHVYINVSFASRTVVIFIRHDTCFKACLINWTTLGEPPVGLTTQQG